ncbi:hypothetical protein EWB00_007498 [Schistosoma japonicum]|uniref:Uncharacterized protein n=1 Tax=Schistosoma japonicum TaxID=6182 RepID=A0A4Z2CU46_SCHJA|nr:hypothetical protein EWB00_007498 [Schistosoma japonicum]
MISIQLNSTVLLVTMVIIGLLVNCNRIEHDYDETLMDSYNMDYLSEIPNRELWYRRIREPRHIKQKINLRTTVKRPQKSANYYYDLYRQSMLPTNEFLG